MDTPAAEFLDTFPPTDNAEPHKHLQTKMRKVLDEESYHNLCETVDHVTAKVIEGHTSYEAMAWHSSTVYVNGNCLSNEEVTTKLKLELCLSDMNLYIPGSVLHKCPGATCTKTLSIWHILTCPQCSAEGYHRNSTHNAIRDAVMSCANNAGIPSSTRTYNLLPTAVGSDGKRKTLVMDAIFPDLAGHRTGVDISLVHPVPLSSSELHAPHRSAQKDTTDYISERESKKHAKYAAACKSVDVTFIALCMTTYGQLGSEFLQFVDTIATYAARNQVGSLDFRTEQRKKNLLRTIMLANVNRILIKHITGRIHANTRASMHKHCNSRNTLPGCHRDIAAVQSNTYVDPAIYDSYDD